MEIIKAAAVGIAAVLMALQFKQTKSEYGMYITLAAGLLIFGMAVSCLGTVTEGIETIASLISVDSKYIAILLKVTGIAYLCEFSANLCRDSGYASVASQIEMAGKLSILVMSLPIVTALLETVNSFMQ